MSCMTYDFSMDMVLFIAPCSDSLIYYYDIIKIMLIICTGR